MDLEAEITKIYNANRKTTDEDRSNTVSGGNAGVQTADGAYHSTTSSSCPRIVALRTRGVQSPIDFQSIMTFEGGFALERVFSLLKQHPDVKSWEEQKSMFRTLDSGTVWRGTPDFLVNWNGKQIVFDTKSVASVSSYISFVKNGDVKHEYVAQLATYMHETGSDTGFLVAGVTPWVSQKFMTAGTNRQTGGSIKPGLTAYRVSIVKDDIYFNKQLWKFKLSDVLRHRDSCGEAIATNKLPPRPEDFAPCHFCPFKSACVTFNSADEYSIDEFVDSVQASAVQQQGESNE